MSVIHDALKKKYLKDNLTNILKDYKDENDIVDISHIRKFTIELYCCNRQPWLSNAWKAYLYYASCKKIEITVRDLQDFIKKV